MQTINELNYLVEVGTLSKEAAERILNAVTGSMADVHATVCEMMGGEGELEKTAGKADLGSQLMTGLLSSVGLTLGGMGVNYLAKEWDKSKTQAAHNRSFHEMHRVRPEISDIDPQKTQEYFSVLADTAPDLAKNPFIAANFVQRQAQGYGGVGFEEAGSLARANEALSRAKGPSQLSQLGESLTQQGLSSIGSNVGYVTRLGIDEALKKSPEEIGKEQAMMEATKDQYLRQSGMADRALEDKRKEMELRDAFARKSERRKEDAAYDMQAQKHQDAKELQGMKDRSARGRDDVKFRRDMEVKQREHDADRDRSTSNYNLALDQYKHRWGAGPGRAIADPSAFTGGKADLRSKLVEQGFDVLKKDPRRSPRIDYSGVRI